MLVLQPAAVCALAALLELWSIGGHFFGPDSPLPAAMAELTALVLGSICSYHNSPARPNPPSLFCKPSSSQDDDGYEACPSAVPRLPPINQTTTNKLEPPSLAAPAVGTPPLYCSPAAGVRAKDLYITLE